MRKEIFIAMRKKLTEAIKAKFVGIDENTAMRLAERALKKGEPITTDDEVAAAVDAITLSDVLKSVSDFSADDATRKYEAKYNLENGVPKKEPEKPKETEKEAKPKEEVKKEADPMAEFKAMFSDAIKSLTGKIDAMNTEISSIKTGKVAETRKAKLDQITKNLRDSQRKAYSRIPVDKMSDDEFENLLSEVSEEVNDIIAENKAAGSTITAPLGVRHHEPSGNAKEASKEELDALVGKFNL